MIYVHQKYNLKADSAYPAKIIKLLTIIMFKS